MSLSLKNLDDNALVNIFCTQKNTEALGILYNRYAHLVYGVCLKYIKQADEAKDISMQVFEKLMTELPKHEIQVFKAWLYRVAQNQCLMHLRKSNHITKLVDNFPENSMEYDNETHPIEEKEYLLDRMEHAIEELAEEQKICLKRFYLEKKSYEGIMQETGYTFNQVKSYIQNGKRNLKLLLTKSITHE